MKGCKCGVFLEARHYLPGLNNPRRVEIAAPQHEENIYIQAEHKGLEMERYRPGSGLAANCGLECDCFYERHREEKY